jgi:hypothetical protein
VTISQQHRSSPVQVQDCGIQRLKGGLDVGQPLAVLGGQAASSRTVAASPRAAWPAAACSCWIAAAAARHGPVAHRSDAGEHPCGLAGQQL